MAKKSNRATATKSARTTPISDDLATAKAVIETEIEGLRELDASLNGDFISAVDKLARVRGRVIVSGVGKSGQIGVKIASTLSSTGTPAQFVHSGEASHGDLGMITRDDAVLMISNSGESQELAALTAHAKRYNIPLIAMCAKADSALMRAADVKLLLPQAPEACPMGLAPTTSSTMTLALGDALAVALMARKGFTSDDYRVLHPGGQLGKSLLRVQDIMHSGAEMPLVRADTSMRDMILEMTSKRLGCVGVLDESGRLMGIFTDGDLRRHIDSDVSDKTASDVMTPNPKTIRQTALVAEAVGFMNNSNITMLFVINEEQQSPDAPRKPKGIIHLHDCLRAGVN